MSDAQLPHPSSFALESYSVGGLAGAERDEVTAHVMGCQTCKDFVGALERLARQRLVDESPAVFAARITERSRPRGRLPQWSGKSWALVPAAAAAAVVLFALWPARPPPEGVWRERGELAGRVHRMRNGVVTRLAPNDPVRAGDALRVEVVASQPGFVTAFLLDDGCRISWYAPTSAGAPPLAFAGGEVLLPGSVVLDAAISPERIVVVVRPTVDAVGAVVDQVRGACGARGAVRFDDDTWLPAVPGWWSMFLPRER